MVRCETLDLRSWIDWRNRQIGIFLVFMLIAAWSLCLAPAVLSGQETTVVQKAVTPKAASKQEAAKAPSAGAPSAGAPSAKAVDESTGLNLKSLEQRLKATLGKVTPAVVAVDGGSGVVVSEDGYVLTVAHVGRQAGRRVTVTFPDGRKVRGITLGNDRGVDAGLIKLNGDGPYPFAKMGVSKELKEGQWCIALGYPVSFARGKAPAVRIGRVLSNRDTTVVTDCTIMGGDSGGPLFDMDGTVIGVSSRCDNRLTVNIHVPVDCYTDTWDRMLDSNDFNSQTRGIAFLGVTPAEGTDDARIGEVFPRTGASRAGLKAGDVLLKFDGKKLSKYSELPPLIERRKPGEEIEIVVKRGEEVLTLKAKLGDRDE